ncbi:MAG TPA: ACT domain-containing protein [Parvularculaceae bacterium]|nr:ACT domain-containing protein [Parvularculaceae bacterium]
MAAQIQLKRLAGEYGFARLEAHEAIPRWADGEGFVSIGRTEDELSIICLGERMPETVKRNLGWTCYKFQGPFAFSESGILLSVIRPLSENSVGVFAISTFDTDYLLIKSEHADRAERLMAGAGHAFIQ